MGSTCKIFMKCKVIEMINSSNNNFSYYIQQHMQTKENFFYIIKCNGQSRRETVKGKQWRSLQHTTKGVGDVPAGGVSRAAECCYCVRSRVCILAKGASFNILMEQRHDSEFSVNFHNDGHGIES